MDIAILGVNVPAPPIRIKKEHLEEYVRLYVGLRNRKDTVTWRTFIITTKKLLGGRDPENKPLLKSKTSVAKRLVKFLIKGTYMESLFPEVMYALGLRGKTGNAKKLEFLLVNGRHHPEPLLFSLADFIKSKGKSVAVINPVGHYNDEQTRVIGPSILTREVEKMVILSSTQSKQRGSVSVLSNVIRLLRNEDFTKKIKEVDIVVPMYGGSRGHRIGQADEIGFEVIEAGFNAKLLSLPTKDLLEKLKKDGVKNPPKVRFFSVDIHNDLYPSKVFKEEGFDFISVDPSNELADEVIRLIKIKKVVKLPIRIVACDKGAIPRTERLVKKILARAGRSFKNVQVIYMDKKRSGAGVISSVEIGKIERWKKGMRGRILRRSLKIPTKPNMSKFILVYSDDMIDTGGTAAKDMEFLSTIFPNPTLKIFVATHPVFSKGFSAIKKIGADHFVLGNTLNYDGLSETKGVSVVDMASAIYRDILKGF